MTNQTDPRTALLARLSQWHPGREHEALDYAITYSRTKCSEPITNEIAFVAAWPDEQLAKIPLPRHEKPKCPDCDGSGWLPNPDQLTPCPHCKRRTP